jgi:hypothetical protein
MIPRATWIALFSVVFSPCAVSATATYTIPLPSQDAAVYEIPFQVMHPGRVTVEVEWDDPRIVALRVEGPDDVVSRRSGPSPQRLDVDVTDDPAALGGRWRVWVRVPPGREERDGRLTLTLPDAPEVVALREEALAPPPPPPPTPDPWTVPREAPSGATPALALLFDRVESYRATVYPSDRPAEPDGCGWQGDLARWLSRTRDQIAGGGPAPDPVTRTYLARVAAAVRSVEEMRTSENPLLAGPVPDDSLRRRAWEAARRDELRGLERTLDALGERLRDGKVPELQDLDWPPRFVACLTAAERYFEARVRLGDEAANQDVARAQWPAFLAAAPALESLAADRAP